ncbi:MULTISPECIES: hypothetical protein [Roseomonadaceae]|uniref:Uncharacterized protein n=1 Tax=Falsiroseomonas oleicola TaxID=2801474 RepID=A0ABS6H141_9PROT|nr:hypothetical protein [Roseomonas oleicola]MBU8542371.1 hypothetical protein [Roseomonas oleicola]
MDLDSEAKASLKKLLASSGFGQEIVAAGDLHRAGWRVNLHAFFHDLDENKAREIDIVANKRFAADQKSYVAIDVEIAIEIKASKEPFFVFRGRHSDQYYDLVPYSWRYSTLKTDHEAVSGTKRDLLRRIKLPPGDFLVHKPKSASGTDRALKTFGGLLQVIKASYHLQEEREPANDGWQKWSKEHLRRLAARNKRYLFENFSMAFLVCDGPILLVQQEFSWETFDFDFDFIETECAVLPVRYSSPAYKFAHQPVIVCTLKHFPKLLATIERESRLLLKALAKRQIKSSTLPRIRRPPNQPLDRT